MEINDTLIDFWIKNNRNVLMIGKAGTGKTTMISQGFERNGLKWKYFSAPTMDPWVDFVGVPKEKINENGNSYLAMIQPQEFADDQVEAIFFDEFNRAKPKVIDAVMELTQFKSINGRKFKNLRMIWAGINPAPEDSDDDEHEYAVERLDPAHKDRFHIHVEIEYKLSEEFFHTKFPQYADAGISWWNSLKPAEKNKVSPRRLEYALQEYASGGDIGYVLPPKINASSLLSQLKNGSFSKKLAELFKAKDDEKSKKALLNENFYSAIIHEILEDEKMLEHFAANLPNEKFNNLYLTDEKFKTFVLSTKEHAERNIENLKNIIEAEVASPKIIKDLKDKLTAYDLFHQEKLNTILENHYNNLSKEFFDDNERPMRISSFLQTRDISGFDLSELTKATIIIALIVDNKAMNWPSCKIALQNIKDATTKLGHSFEDDVVKPMKKDAMYKKFLANGETRSSKMIAELK